MGETGKFWVFLGGAIVAVLGVAALAVVFSQNSQAPAVITNAGNALSGVIAAAVKPVTG